LQATLLNVVIDALVVFLFWAISSARPDDRLRCWLGGWVCILIHFGADLWSPSSTLWETVQNCVSVDALALAGILFAVSTMVLTEGRRTGLWLGGLLAISTVPCLCLAIIGLHSIWPLSIVLLARQVLAVSLAASGTYLAGASWPLVIDHFQFAYGWRATHVGIGLFLPVVMVPLVLALTRKPAAAAYEAAEAATLAARGELGLSANALQAVLMVAGRSELRRPAASAKRLRARAGDSLRNGRG